MMSYLLHTTIFLGATYLVYLWFLKREKTFVVTRYYLLVTLLLSIAAPFIEIETSLLAPAILNNTALTETMTFGHDMGEGVVIEQTRLSAFSVTQTILTFYCLITGLLIMRFIRHLWHLIKDLKQKGSVMADMQIVLKDNVPVPYSFFHFLFVDKATFHTGSISPMVLQHELAHSRQFHSIDLLLAELIACFLWANPFVWLYKKAITGNHEYLADEAVINIGTNPEAYATTILHYTKQNHSRPLVSGFSYLKTKNRLIMLTQNKPKNRSMAFKITGMLVLMSAIFLASSFSFTDNENPLTVVIDPGHGGDDYGVPHQIVPEKDINLAISQQVAALSNEKDVKIILTRDTDKALSLNDRVNFINSHQPDLFLSIHCNNDASSPNRQGIEVSYYEGSNKERSYALSKTLTSAQIGNLSNQVTIETRDYKVLREANSAGILINLGFLSNEKERLILEDPKEQEAIAAAIYKRLVSVNH